MEVFYFTFMDAIPSNNPTTFNFGYVVAIVSFILFYLNTTIGFLPRIAPKSVRNTENQLWKWKNTANSLLHSFITGVGTIICFCLTPEIRHSMISIYTNASVFLISVSVGYFIHDFCDLALNSKSGSKFGLLLHHFLVILCFGLALVTRHYQGYGLVSLLVEVNSIFLHIRQLLIIQVTFVFCRFVNLAWLIQWLFFHRSEVSTTTAMLGYITNSTVMVLNMTLFIRILSKDFTFVSRKSTSKSK